MDKPNITYAFTDIETTGLDAYAHVPLEIAVVLTDEWGYQVAECSYLVHDGTAAFKQEVAGGKAHPIVGPMHEKSGLWHDLDHREMLSNWGSIYEVDIHLEKFLKENEVEPGTVPMAGNSIGSLDRPFVLAHFPKFNQALSYRNVDMSSFKEVCKKVNPSLYANLEPIIGNKDNASHRALDDAKASIAEYRAYLDNFLFTE
jgi:oligoribonuclease